MAINRVVLRGNLVADPVMRYTDNGLNYVFFTIVTNSYNPKTQESKASFHDCVAFQANADHLCNKAKKGTPIYFEGRLSYQTSGEGETFKKDVKLVAYMVEVLRHWEKKDANNPGSQPAPQQVPAPAPQPTATSAPGANPAVPHDDKDDLPF